VMENSTFPGKEEASNDGRHVVKGKIVVVNISTWINDQINDQLLCGH